MKSKKRKSSWVDDGKVNFYEILKLPSRYEVNLDSIKKSYKKLALVHHPDKQEDYGEKEKEEWLKVKFKRDSRSLWNADWWNQEEKVRLHFGLQWRSPKEIRPWKRRLLRSLFWLLQNKLLLVQKHKNPWLRRLFHPDVKGAEILRLLVQLRNLERILTQRRVYFRRSGKQKRKKVDGEGEQKTEEQNDQTGNIENQESCEFGLPKRPQNSRAQLKDWRRKGEEEGRKEKV